MKKITIVDDDSDLRDLLQVVLRFNDFKVEVFSNGEDFITNHKGETNLYIIDINLGGITGLDICKDLKNNDRTRHIPIIVISAHPEIEKLAKEVCADASLPKPFSQKTRIELISFYLQKTST